MNQNLNNKNKNEIPTFGDDFEDDDNDADKILTLEDFRKKAFEKLDSKNKGSLNKKKN